MAEKWKDRLYDMYISSGQAPKPEGTALSFASREPYIKQIISRYLPEDRQVRIVDLGCGHGTFLYFLREAGYSHLEGVDLSSEQVAYARELGIPDVRQSAIMPYLDEQPKESIDVILLMDVLEHLTRQQLFDTLHAVFHVLRPGGKCIIHVPNAEGMFGMRIRYGDLTHELAFSPRSIRQIFSALGFDKIQCVEDKPIAHGWKSTIRRIIWSIGTVYPRLLFMAETGSWTAILSQNMLVIAEKVRA